MNIFFDFDGTLIDSRSRLYKLFQHLVSKSSLSFDEYWSLKRSKVSHQEILRSYFDYSDIHISKFQEVWMNLIEKSEWLKFDIPFEGIEDYLIELKRQNKLYLVTARQSKEVAINQLVSLGWNGIFNDVFVTCQKVEKSDLIKNSVVFNSKDWFVGDTGKDVETGKSLGLRTAAVLSGFLSEEKLLEYGPTLIASYVTEINFKSIDES